MRKFARLRALSLWEEEVNQIKGRQFGRLKFRGFEAAAQAVRKAFAVGEKLTAQVLRQRCPREFGGRPYVKVQDFLRMAEFRGVTQRGCMYDPEESEPNGFDLLEFGLRELLSFKRPEVEAQPLPPAPMPSPVVELVEEPTMVPELEALVIRARPKARKPAVAGTEDVPLPGCAECGKMGHSAKRCPRLRQPRRFSGNDRVLLDETPGERLLRELADWDGVIRPARW